MTDAHIKQSSGIAGIDAHALNWIRSFKYNKRPGCGIVDSKTAVTVDFSGD